MRSVILGLLGWMTAMVGPGWPAVEAGERSPVTFERDVEPILTRAGCNAGACHGKSRGQNGFALSLLGFDPVARLRCDRRRTRADGGCLA